MSPVSDNCFVIGYHADLELTDLFTLENIHSYKYSLYCTTPHGIQLGNLSTLIIADIDYTTDVRFNN